MSIAQIISNKASRLFIFLAGLFITNTLVAEFIGIKIFSLENTFGFDSLNLTILGNEGLGLNLTAGVLIWPIVFVMTDVINEYYGTKAVKMLSYLTIGLISFAFLAIYCSIALAPNPWWQNESGKLASDASLHIADMSLAFNKIMGQGGWIIIASMVAFLIGQIVDVAIFHRIKKWTGEQKIWLRATGSTVVSQFIDSYVVLIVAFHIGSDWGLDKVIAIGTVNYMYKFFMAVALTPLIYLAHYIIERYLGPELAERLKTEAAA